MTNPLKQFFEHLNNRDKKWLQKKLGRDVIHRFQSDTQKMTKPNDKPPAWLIDLENEPALVIYATLEEINETWKSDFITTLDNSTQNELKWIHQNPPLPMMLSLIADTWLSNHCSKFEKLLEPDHG